MVILQRKEKSLQRLQSVIKVCVIAVLIASINTAAIDIPGAQILASSRINIPIYNPTQRINIPIYDPNPRIADNTLDQAIAIRSIKLPLISNPSQKQIYQYKGQIVINVDGDQAQTITFKASFVQDDGPCTFKKCFLGWISQYKVNNDETIQGYPNASGLQPIFEFDTNNDDDNKITYSNDLDETWKQLIQIACQKFNPNFQSKTRQYKISQPPINNYAASTGLRSAAFFAQPIQKIATLQDNNLKIANLDSQKANLAQNIKLDTADNFITQRTQNLEITLNSQNAADQQGPTPDLNGKISINFDLITRNRDSASTIKNLKTQLSQKTIKFAAFSRASLEKTRASSQISQKLNIDSDFKQQDIEPKIQLIQQNLISGQQLDKFDISNEIRTAEIQGINDKNDDAKQLPEFDAININEIKQFELTQNNLQEANQKTLNTAANQLQGLNFKQISINALNQRNLQTATVNILSYTKSLYKKTVLGKTIQLQIQVKCDLLIYPFTQKVRCVGNLIYNIFGNIKTLKIYEFTKTINSAWSWQKTYSGSWSFSFKVPLPPPVSFITINFYVGIKYYFSINLFSKKLSQIPYKWQLGLIAETGIDTDARASLRIWPLQGGVFIKGTLVKVGTDPSLTFNFLFAQKKIQILISWYFWIIAFKFQWGFFYRYWKLFSGWSGIKIIAKWNINGIYKKYKILYQYIYKSY